MPASWKSWASRGEDLHAPAIRASVYASISGFGQTDRIATARPMTWWSRPWGLMSVTGEAGGNPARVGVSIGDIGAGLYATIGIQSALFKRVHTGVGERVDISMLDCQVALLENPIARYFRDRGRAKAARHPPSFDDATLSDMFATKDGFIVIAVGNDALSSPSSATPSAAANGHRRQDSLRCRRAMNTMSHSRLAWSRAWLDATTSEWETVLEAAGIPHGLDEQRSATGQ
ncbi:CoA transferase [Cupriavidus basilensis]